MTFFALGMAIAILVLVILGWLTVRTVRGDRRAPVLALAWAIFGAFLVAYIGLHRYAFMPISPEVLIRSDRRPPYNIYPDSKERVVLDGLSLGEIEVRLEGGITPVEMEHSVEHEGHIENIVVDQ